MNTFKIDRVLAKCCLFVVAINVIVSLILLFSASSTENAAKTSVILQMTSMVSIYALLAGAYGISSTQGAERVFSIILCMMFFVMLNVEANSKFLGIGLVSSSALLGAAGLVCYVARIETSIASRCVRDLCSFALSRNSLPFAASTGIYVLARVSERGFGNAPQSGWPWLLHQASLMAVMVLFVYAACPYIRREAAH